MASGSSSRPRLSAAGLRILISGILIATAAPTWAMTVRHDVAHSSYQTYGAQFPTGLIQIGGSLDSSGTLFQTTHDNGLWVLTAGHVTATDPNTNLNSITFTLGGTTVGVTETHRLTSSASSGNDLGLLKLDAKIAGVTPATLYTGSRDNLVGQGLSYTGYGITGTGLTGSQPGTGGTLRGGTNVADLKGGQGVVAGYSDRILFSDFDSPSRGADGTNQFGSTTATSHEMNVALYDSGGGLFVDAAGEWQLAGVHSFVLSDGDSLAQDYGDMSASTTIEANLAWISQWTEPMLGDVDRDGDVDNVDIGIATGNFTGAGGSTSMLFGDGDMDGDGDVDNLDIGTITGAFTGALSGTPMTVGDAATYAETDPTSAFPEPTTLVVLAAGTAGLAMRRRRA
jgi:hypothetical protein